MVPRIQHGHEHVPFTSPKQPSGARDEGKQELFGGGRRMRPRSNNTNIDPPFGVSRPSPTRDAVLQSPTQHAVRHGRRVRNLDSNLDSVPESGTSLQLGLPLARPPPSNSQWRQLDDAPLSLSGATDHSPEARSRVLCPDTSWRKTRDEPLTLNGEAAAAPVHILHPDTRWRGPDHGSLPEIVFATAGRFDGPLPFTTSAPSAAAIAPSPPPPANRPVRDSDWRKGYEDYSLAPKQPPKPSRERIVSGQEWRRTDSQPFAFDGRPLERETLDPLRSKQLAIRIGVSERLEGGIFSDSQPWSFQHAGAPNSPQHAPSTSRPTLTPHPGLARDHLVARMAGGFLQMVPQLPKNGTRERQLKSEIELSVQRLSYVSGSSEELVNKLRRGDRVFM